MANHFHSCYLILYFRKFFFPFLLLDEPTNHLDLESITSLNKGLCNFDGELIFTSRDYELNSTVANRVIEIKEDGTIIDREIPYEEYIEKKEK